MLCLYAHRLDAAASRDLTLALMRNYIELIDDQRFVDLLSEQIDASPLI